MVMLSDLIWPMRLTAIRDSRGNLVPTFGRCGCILPQYPDENLGPAKCRPAVGVGGIELMWVARFSGKILLRGKAPQWITSPSVSYTRS